MAPQTSRWPFLYLREEPAPLPYTPQTIATSFRAVQLLESGFVPPDSMGDVGPTQILAATNGRIKVFNKNGMLGALNTVIDTFFASVGGETNGTSDPHVRYDRLSGRWFLVIISIDAVNDILVAVSDSPTITDSTSFTFFSFQHDLIGTTPNADTGLFADYPTLGVDKFALYVGVNVFNFNGPTFTGTTGFVINKADLLADTLTVTAFRQLSDSNGPGPFTPQGVHNDDPGATEGYFIGVDQAFFGELVVRRVSNPGGVPAISGNLDITVPATSLPIDQPQPPIPLTNPKLDALDDRLFAAAIHKNKITGAATLWTAHNIEVNSSGVADISVMDNRNGSRWYEIGNLTTTPSLIQSGTLFDSAASNPLGFWIPSVAVSGQGHMAIGSSRAGLDSVNGFAGVASAGRLRADPLGTIRVHTLAQSSTTVYNTSSPGTERWGDYSQVVLDPSDDMTMWTFQEYCDATNSWGVRAIQLRAPPPATPATASPPTVSSGQSFISVTVNGTSISGSEFFDPGPDSGGPGYPNHISASISGGVTVNSVTFVSPTQAVLNISTVGASAGAKDVTIINPDGQSRTGTSLLTVTAGIAGIYVLDGFGGVHAGGGAPVLSPATPYFGFDIARDLELSGTGSYVLDGFGGVHAGGGAPAMTPGTPYFGVDIAEDLELGASGFYVLDGFGGAHAGGGASVLSPAPPYFGFDVARALELRAAGGAYVLDGFGGVHAAGGAPVMSPATPYFGFDIAEDLELASTGYQVLDGFGGVHAGGGASAMSPATPYFGFDIAKGLELAGSGFYVLDGFGGVHAGGGAAAPSPATPYFGFDIARDLEIP